MSDDLSDLQLRVLRFMERRKDQYDQSVCYLDDILNDLSSDGELGEDARFHRQMGKLEEQGHVEMVCAGYRHREEVKYKCYRITAKGLRSLQSKGNH